MTDQDVLTRREFILKLFREFDPTGMTAEQLFVVRKLAHYAETGLDFMVGQCHPESTPFYCELADEAGAIHSRVCGEQERTGGVL
jgi:hypothetical protein